MPLVGRLRLGNERSGDKAEKDRRSMGNYFSVWGLVAKVTENKGGYREVECRAVVYEDDRNRRGRGRKVLKDMTVQLTILVHTRSGTWSTHSQWTLTSLGLAPEISLSANYDNLCEAPLLLAPGHNRRTCNGDIGLYIAYLGRQVNMK